MATELAYEEMLKNVGPRMMRMLVEETRRNWVLEMELLLEAIRVPKVLFWFSERGIDYQEGYRTVHQLMGLFPQLVNRAMVDEVRPLVTSYVECISSRGMPHKLRNKDTGEAALVALGNNKEPRDTNAYYPSPEMHEDAARALSPVVSRLKKPRNKVE